MRRANFLSEAPRVHIYSITDWTLLEALDGHSEDIAVVAFWHKYVFRIPHRQISMPKFRN